MILLFMYLFNCFNYICIEQIFYNMSISHGLLQCQGLLTILSFFRHRKKMRYSVFLGIMYLCLLCVFVFYDIMTLVMTMEEKYQQRKPTRIKKYDYNSVGVYFVTICTQDRKQILSEIVKTNNSFICETNKIIVEDVAPYKTTFDNFKFCIDI